MSKSERKYNAAQKNVTESTTQTHSNAAPTVASKPVIDMSRLSLDGGAVNNNIQGQHTGPETNFLDVVKNIINSGVNVIEKLTSLNNNYGKLAASLMEYEIKMNTDNSAKLDQNEIGSNNYNLYNRLVKVINIKDYPEFVKQFDIVNFVFNKYKDSAYSEFSINRADLHFTGDKVQLKTFQHIITLICILCDPVKRVENKRIISTNAALNRNVIQLTETAYNNIVQYYNI